MKSLSKDHLFDNFSDENDIALSVNQGEVFVLYTYNCLSDLEAWKKEIKKEKPRIMNVTGPIYIDGAKPGNVLRVDILDLKLTADEGVIVAYPGKGGFAEKIDDITAKKVKIDDHFVYFSADLKIPISPMLGKVGVAPKHGEEGPSSVPGPFGGNMDNKRIRKGSSVYLPVFVEGAYLGVGDAHAVQGDGESIISAVETEAEVILRCYVVSDLNLTHPVVVDSRRIMTIGDGETLEEACKTALYNMSQLIMDRLRLNFLDSAMLISIIGDLRICQIVNARVTVRLEVPNYLLPLL